ncbi:hypothetical protein DFP72DRAFT_539091 [Ephemerocybe angulata]|uniref:Uncharacterized protein n=1 Tax=Ephemerocybe angulata TaxID=980116 RepID=A0A8H6M092_9AGAR|nr:hypothetical protein DFP72DRAFT_539091 [Tulosesus angulatus]
MNSMLDAFKIKPFDLEPVLAEWTDGPVFKGKPKKDLPVEEWLEQIKAGCVQRNVPEEYWYKAAQHFMGPKAKARFDEVKKVIVTVNGGKYRWTWKKFKVAMTNMGWDIDSEATETVKVRGTGVGAWFSRKKSEEKKDAPSASSSVSEPPKRPTPSRSNTLRWTKKPLVEEPCGIEEEPTPRPKPSRSRTLASESSFWGSRKDTQDDSSSIASSSKGEKKREKSVEKKLPARPPHQKARSETMVVRRGSKSEVSRSHTTNEHDKEVSPVVVTGKAPVWLLNAVNALDFLTSEHPKAVSVVSAILITVGSIPAIPAISAGAGGAILASGAAHAIGAIAVGLGQALGSTVKNSQQKHEESS